MRALHLLVLLALGLFPSIAQAAEAGVLRPVVPGGLFLSEGTRVVGEHGSFLYVVQGAPQMIRGMGYNAPLSALPEADRHRRLYRDFPLMRQVGVNTIVGWDQAGFDRALLDAAYANGIGVVMPFELAKEWDYGDSGLRERLLDQIGAWVDEYKDHPAVRMWGVGNEVMLAMNDEESRQFAAFYVQVYETVRQHDQLHPIVYREAEDVRVPYFRDAFAEAHVEPVDFVVGMNFYTPRMADALAEYPEIGFDVPVLISEFAPAGVAPSARASAFHDLWNTIQPYERYVLGAAPYAWTTDGPEAVDRLFGLTDGQGHPVDAALGELQRIYRGRVPANELLPAPTPPTRQALGMALDAAVAQALARAMAQPTLDPVDLDVVRAEARDRYGRDLASAPGAAHADQRLMARMLDLLVDTATLAALKEDGRPVYPGAREAEPLVAGLARWAATDPSAEPMAEAFLTEVVGAALRLPLGAVPTPS